jgi:ABC-type Na+ efflux pump permease subunit
MYAAVVRYEVNGQSYRTTQEIASGSPMYATGATVTVAYDPANPGAGRILGVLELFFMSGLLLIVSLACFAAAAASGRARRSIKKRR